MDKIFSKIVRFVLVYWTTKIMICYWKNSGVRALVVQVQERLVDFPVFFGKRHLMAFGVIGDLHVANGTFEFLEMVGHDAGQ